jgi:hydroxylysine kinase
LTALAARQPVFSSSLAGEIARDLFGIDGTPQPLYGERNQNFRIAAASESAGIILKILDEDPDVVDLQIACLQHVAKVDPGLPVPRVMNMRDGGSRALIEGTDGRPYIVYALSFLAGALLEEKRADQVPLVQISTC